MLHIVSPIELLSYKGDILVYDTDDMTAEFHNIADVAEAMHRGVKIESAYISYDRGIVFMSGWYDYADIFRTFPRDDIMYEYIYAGGIDHYHIFIVGDSDCFAFREGYEGDSFNKAWGLNTSYDYVLSPPVNKNGKIGFYIVGGKDSKYASSELTYDWHEFATSPLVKHSRELCDRVKKMLLLGSDGREVLGALGVV